MSQSRASWWVEALIGLLVLWVVGALLIPRMGGRIGPQFAKVKSDLFSIRSALDAYKAQNGDYPSTAQGLEALLRQPFQGKPPMSWKGPYLTGGETSLLDPWKHAFVYRSPGATPNAGYLLFSLGPDGLPETDDDIVQ